MRTDLRKGDMACLGRLIDGPIEIGAISEKTVARLMDRGLVVQVLGCCEITGFGQLTYHRQQYPKTPPNWIVSTTLTDPLNQQAISHGAHQSSSRIRQASEFPYWLMRKVWQTAGQLRSSHTTNASSEATHSHIEIETD